MKMKAMMLAAIGGAAGTVLRYMFTFVLPQQPFAFATLAANLGGSFLLALLTAMWAGRILDEKLKPLLGTGFCGGFTTMSAFAGEFYYYVSMEMILYSAVYLSVSLLGGLGMGVWGYAAGKKFIKLWREGEQS
jgi:CrcB protein